MGELERLDIIIYGHMRLEILNEVLKFIEGQLDIPALRTQGLEVNAIIDEVMAVTDQHPRAQMPNGTTSNLGTRRRNLVVRSEALFKWERKMALRELGLTYRGEEYLASLLNARGIRRDGLLESFDFLFGLAYWQDVTSM
ncbi:hypothetical protein FA95DRAFT_1564214 [Auriscalpium vulgare]|uniref:Uncharacterized protein n=1 Tax=Auriscalpium vulgare TaxID=40419 RepID=A0ACB8RF82_9AGAM|nr:hypothetical protein FA95DRAFT_1564214 [Auriscalpium vulgare]